MGSVNVDFESLGQAVKKKRKERGLTQKSLGEKFGLSQTYIGLIELGKVKGTDNKVREIISFLDNDKPKAVQKKTETEEAQVTDASEKTLNVSEKSSSPRNKGQRDSSRPWSSGKEKRRFWEWLQHKTKIGIKLANGELLEGFIKWYDTYSLKLVTLDNELVIPKHSILYYIDAPKRTSSSNVDKE